MTEDEAKEIARAKNRAKKARRMARIKADPERYAAHLEQQRERSRARRAALRQSPSDYAEELRRVRESGARHRAKLAALNPPKVRPGKPAAPVPRVVDPEEHAHITPQMRAEMRLRQRQMAHRIVNQTDMRRILK